MEQDKQTGSDSQLPQLAAQPPHLPPVQGAQPPLLAAPTLPPDVAPVASAIGQTAAQTAVDDSALPADDRPVGGQMTQVGDKPVAPGGPSPSVPPSGQPFGDNKTVKLPVPTNTVPAIAIGVLILVLLAAVAAYAFLV